MLFFQPNRLIPAFLALALAFALAQGSSAAEGNIAELRILEITPDVRAGEIFRASFLAGNRSGPACPASIQYWFEEGGEKALQGNDTVYLGQGGKVEQSIELAVLPTMEGAQRFFLELECNNATAMASRAVYFSKSLPEVPHFKGLEVLQSEAQKQVVFSYSLESNAREAVPVEVEERVMQGGKAIWVNVEKVSVKGSASFKRYGPRLPQGEYVLVVDAVGSHEEARLERDFEVSNPAWFGATLPFLAKPGSGFLALVLGFIILATAILLLSRKYLQPRISSFMGFQPAAAASPPFEGDEGGAGNAICHVETESMGSPGERELAALVKDAGIEGEREARAFEVSSRVPVVQNVKSCILWNRESRARFETIVTVTVANETTRDWENVVLLARLPHFLAGDISWFSSDAGMQAKAGNGVAEFVLEKVGAMRSASVAYKAGKLVSRKEAESIELPAVIDFKAGKKVHAGKGRMKRVHAEKVLNPGKGKKA